VSKSKFIPTPLDPITWDQLFTGLKRLASVIGIAMILYATFFLGESKGKNDAITVHRDEIEYLNQMLRSEQSMTESLRNELWSRNNPPLVHIDPDTGSRLQPTGKVDRGDLMYTCYLTSNGNASTYIVQNFPCLK